MLGGIQTKQLRQRRWEGMSKCRGHSLGRTKGQATWIKAIGPRGAAVHQRLPGILQEGTPCYGQPDSPRTGRSFNTVGSGRLWEALH